MKKIRIYHADDNSTKNKFREVILGLLFQFDIKERFEDGAVFLYKEAITALSEYVIYEPSSNRYNRSNNDFEKIKELFESYDDSNIPDVFIIDMHWVVDGIEDSYKGFELYNILVKKKVPHTNIFIYSALNVRFIIEGAQKHSPQTAINDLKIVYNDTTKDDIRNLLPMALEISAKGHLQKLKKGHKDWLLKNIETLGEQKVLPNGFIFQYLMSHISKKEKENLVNLLFPKRILKIPVDTKNPAYPFWEFYLSTSDDELENQINYLSLNILIDIYLHLSIEHDGVIGENLLKIQKRLHCHKDIFPKGSVRTTKNINNKIIWKKFIKAIVFRRVLFAWFVLIKSTLYGKDRRYNLDSKGVFDEIIGIIHAESKNSKFKDLKSDFLLYKLWISRALDDNVVSNIPFVENEWLNSVKTLNLDTIRKIFQESIEPIFNKHSEPFVYNFIMANNLLNLSTDIDKLKLNKSKAEYESLINDFKTHGVDKIYIEKIKEKKYLNSGDRINEISEFLYEKYNSKNK